MYWGALSTDIKKSSVNWNVAPDWMQRAVQYHNTIITTVVNYWKGKKTNVVNVQKLPNSPEGDAYTFLFNHKDLTILRNFVINVCFDIQMMLHVVRTDGSGRLYLECNQLEFLDEDGKSMFRSKEYFGGVFIRIGIAFSSEAPIPYSYARYKGKSYPVDTESFRGSVIFMSEEAEKRADYKLMPVIDEDPGPKFQLETTGTNGDVEFDPKKLQKRIKEVPSIKECFYELDDEGNATHKLAFKNIKEREIDVIKQKCARRGSTIVPRSVNFNYKLNDLAARKKRLDEVIARFQKTYKIDQDLYEVKIDQDLYKVKDLDLVLLDETYTRLEEESQVTIKKRHGISIFIKYNTVLKLDMAENNAYMMKYILEEYKDVHKRADDVIKQFLKVKAYRGNEAIYTGGLIKQKRDDSSMYVFYDSDDSDLEARRTRYTKWVPELYEQLAELLTYLPYGSSVGVAIGEMSEVKFSEDGEQYVDYFGECVNLAARMEFKDFSYETRWGIRDKNDHHNRLALTSKDIDLMNEILKEVKRKSIPLTIDNIPLSTLNVGKATESALVISSKISESVLPEIGDTVTYALKKTKVQRVLGLDIVVTKKGGTTEKVDRSEIKLSTVDRSKIKL